ncbi:MAG TPA: SRPBCC domain-containing protein, partial [Streptosporangiaceae bacterium]
YLTRPEAIVSWMGDYAVLDAVPGGVFHLDINGVPVRGRYLELDPPHRLLISWGHAPASTTSSRTGASCASSYYYAGSGRLPPGSSTVEITFTATPEGTRVTVEHRDLPPDETAQHAVGWPHFLARLSVAATGHDPGSDPFAHTT